MENKRNKEPEEQDNHHIITINRLVPSIRGQFCLILFHSTLFKEKKDKERKQKKKNILSVTPQPVFLHYFIQSLQMTRNAYE